MRRSDQRRDAVFACYQRDVTGRPLDELISAARPFTRELAEGVEAERDRLDAEIAGHARGWDLDRIAPLERNIMRVALFEIEHRDDVPAEVAIDEAIELAKRYCGADAPAFVNGVLGATLRASQEAAGGAAVSQTPGRAWLRPIACARSLPDSSRSPLRSGTQSTNDERAAELSREAADLASEAVEEANRLLRGADAG